MNSTVGITTHSIRPPVTTETVASGNVTENAVRLFTKGFLASLRLLGQDGARAIYTLPSESHDDVVYTIEHDLETDVLSCSCPAGQHAVPCKHVRLLQFRQGWVVEE